MSQHYTRENNYKALVRGSNYNDLLRTLQNGIATDSKTPDAFATIYRKKTYSYYTKKITKPFKLTDQPEYYDELNFQQNFKEFVDSIDHFNSIQQKPPKKLDTLQSKVTQETFTTVLTMEPVSIPERQQFLKQIIKKYDVSKVGKVGRSDSITSQKKQQHAVFPSHKTIELYQVERKNRNFSIPKDLNLKNRIGAQDSLRRQNTRFSSPRKSPNRRRDPSIASSPNRKGSNQPFTAGLNRKSSEVSSIKKMLDQDTILSRLNQLNETRAKRNNLRLQRPKFHDLLKNRYGNQVFTIFFGMANIQKFDGIFLIISQLINLELRNSHLLSFLTFDVNQDGLICQEDLYKIANALQVDSIVREDVNKITEWVNRTKTGRSNPDLPADFVSCPTLRGLKRAFDDGNFKAFPDNSTANISATGAAKSYVKQLYSVNYNQYEKDAQLHRSKPNLPHLLKNLKKKTNKKFSINFEMFQEIFKAVHCSFISDLIYYLTRIKMNNNIVDDQIKRNFKKYSQENSWLNYNSQLFKDKVYFNNERKNDVKRWHNDLRDFHKTFSTIKYE